MNKGYLGFDEAALFFIFIGAPVGAQESPVINNPDFVSEGRKDLFPVVVIDSGVDYRHRDISPRLHLNQNTTALQVGSYQVESDLFGWDFNERDERPFDNHYAYKPKFVTVPTYDQDRGVSHNLSLIVAALLKNSLELVKTVLQVGAPGHGTHVSGLVLKNCASCSIVPLKIFGQESLSVESLSAAIEYAHLRGHCLLNLSLAVNRKYVPAQGEQKSYLEDVIQKIASYEDMLFVVAAGNESKHLTEDEHEIYPAILNLPNVITVGAVDRDGNLADFSNYDPEIVDVFALGVEVLSTWNDGGYQEASGTSIATPTVTALIGEIWAKEPNLSVWEVRQKFMSMLVKRVIQFRDFEPQEVLMVPQQKIRTF